MAEESILLKVGIDQNSIKQSEDAIISHRAEIDKLRKANDELTLSEGDNRQAILQNQVAIKDHSIAVRENERVLLANAKMQRSNEGSIASLRESVKTAQAEYVKLSAAERENEKVGGELQKQIESQNNALKALEKQIGITGRNVGNYKDEVKAALLESGLFNKAQEALATAQTIATSATKLATIATRSFGAALIATGIGAIVVALGALIAYLTQTQKGMDVVARATKSVGTFISVLVDAFAKLGEQLFNSVIPTFVSLADIIKGIVTLDFNQVRKGVEGVAKAAKSVDGINILQLGANATKAGIAAGKLQGEMQELIRSEKLLDLEKSKSRKTIQELNLLSEDTTKSNKEREAAAQKAFQIEQSLEAKRVTMAEKRVDIITRENALAENKDADNNRLIEAEMALNDLQEESTGKQIELNNKLNAIRKEASALAASEAAKNKKASDDLAAKELSDLEKKNNAEIKAAEENQKEVNRLFEEGLTERGNKTQIQIQNNINALKAKFAEGTIDIDTFNNELINLEASALAIREASLIELLELNRSNAQIDADTRLAIETDLQEKLRALNTEAIDFEVGERKKLIDIEAKASDEEVKQAKTREQAKQMAMAQSLDAIKTVFGEQSEAGKLAAITQGIIDTKSAAIRANKDFPQPFGAIIAAALVAKGLANVAKIKSTPVPKFAEGGGIEVSGASHATGGVDVALGGQTVANVEGGEGLFVMKKNAFQSLKSLSNFNEMHGGNSWFNGGKKFLADGGAISRGSVPQLDRRSLQEAQTSIGESMQQVNVIARISDINRVSTEMKTVEMQGDLR